MGGACVGEGALGGLCCAYHALCVQLIFLVQAVPACLAPKLTALCPPLTSFRYDDLAAKAEQGTVPQLQLLRNITGTFRPGVLTGGRRSPSLSSFEFAVKAQRLQC